MGMCEGLHIHLSLRPHKIISEKTIQKAPYNIADK